VTAFLTKIDDARTTVPVRGANVACFRAGSGRVPPLVLLHGGGLDSARTTWAPLWHDLVVGGPVLAPDLPGFGATTLGDTSPTIAGYRDWLLALLDALAVDRCVLAGLSLGGAVALKVALAAPHRIVGLGLLAPYGLSPRTPGGRLGWVSVHLPGVTTASYAVLRRSRSALRRRLAMLLRRPGALTDMLIDEVTALLHVPDAGRAWWQLQRDEARWSGPATDLRTALGSVTCPAVLVSAEHDIVPPRDIRSAAKAMRCARFVLISGAGHWLPRDAPTEIAAELINLRHRATSADTCEDSPDGRHDQLN
jgi:pimeloyl-ACP methyl ester carboxylesterase